MSSFKKRKEKKKEEEEDKEVKEKKKKSFPLAGAVGGPTPVVLCD